MINMKQFKKKVKINIIIDEKRKLKDKEFDKK